MPRWLVAAAVGLLPLTASAANGLRPRTPAVFPDAPCVITADAGSVVSIPYEVPFDDVDLTPEELPDSRQMQFFALRQVPFDYTLPTYITQSDLDRAEANGDNTRMYGASDVLESSSAWPAGSWVAITPSDARVPITIEQAAMGIEWSTATSDTGAWVVAAYTWEPENNLWSFRLGVVRLVDPADPDSAGPAAFINAGLQAAPAEIGEPYPVEACVAAPAGSTVTASYGILEGVDEPTWVPFAEDEVVQGDTHSVDLLAPGEASGKSVKVRFEVTDPAGRTYVTYSPYPILVFGDPSASDDDAGSSDDGDDDGGGCSCRAPGVGGDGPPAWWVLCAPVLLWRRSPLPDRAG